MKQKPIFVIIAVIATLALAALACGGGATATDTPAPKPTKAAAPTATEAPKPTAKPTQAVAAGELVVTNQYLFKDSIGYYHIVGKVFNDTEKAVSDIELTIEVTDAGGNTLLRDDSDNPADTLTFGTLLYTVGPGESSPFDFSFYTEAGEPDQFNVTVTGQETGRVNRGNLKIENAQMVSDGSGSLYFTGELVNMGQNPVQINGLAGAALDDDDNVVAANAYGQMSHLLLEAGEQEGYDRTPFRIWIDDPGDDVWTHWAAFWDADEVDPNDVDTYDISLDPQNNYFDVFDSLHLVGLVTNDSDETLSISLVAGVYAEDGTVLDADTWLSPFYLGPGESVPYSFDHFTHINSSTEAANQASNTIVQVDPYWTSATTSYKIIPLETQNDSGGLDGSESDQIWKFTGEVTNTSEEALSNLVVIVAIFDSDDNLVATNWTSVYPPDGRDAIAPGDTVPYELTVYLDPNVDGSEFTFQTLAQAAVFK